MPQRCGRSSDPKFRGLATTVMRLMYRAAVNTQVLCSQTHGSGDTYLSRFDALDAFYNASAWARCGRDAPGASAAPAEPRRVTAAIISRVVVAARAQFRLEISWSLPLRCARRSKPPPTFWPTSPRRFDASGLSSKFRVYLLQPRHRCNVAVAPAVDHCVETPPVSRPCR
ncbi:hypothetical protein B0H15DRAFT_952433 [Mycena belliarum]|uniref:Uncharacterized protein n=1 Tax=Mycena belliarum TaxID=1033014 RepID=A0AAD6XN43_9AGAR|nr:hypothetical protein B0H15DRAFT_952423 [Mycena belliae]KAJ7082728.1 hypothetical protein B0H15DRAFT_952428 [Mycena belliae]KAJ7082734.1 hypothetical protein B0H15DRAFT_952433 [Mycena belliae]